MAASRCHNLGVVEADEVEVPLDCVPSEDYWGDFVSWTIYPIIEIVQSEVD